MFDPHQINQMIANAGHVLQEQWKKQRSPNGAISFGHMPENDLNPSADKLAFQVKLLADQLALVEKTLGDVVRFLNDQKNKGVFK